MTHHERNVTGNQPPGRGGARARRSEAIPATAESAGYTRLPKPFKYWISHRQGPFLIHSKEDCDPSPKVMGCFNSYDNLIEQGFAPCPKCGKE